MEFLGQIPLHFVIKSLWKANGKCPLSFLGQFPNLSLLNPNSQSMKYAPGTSWLHSFKFPYQTSIRNLWKYPWSSWGQVLHMVLICIKGRWEMLLDFCRPMLSYLFMKIRLKVPWKMLWSFLDQFLQVPLLGPYWKSMENDPGAPWANFLLNPHSKSMGNAHGYLYVTHVHKHIGN